MFCQFSTSPSLLRWLYFCFIISLANLLISTVMQSHPAYIFRTCLILLIPFLEKGTYFPSHHVTRSRAHGARFSKFPSATKIKSCSNTQTGAAFCFRHSEHHSIEQGTPGILATPTSIPPDSLLQISHIFYFPFLKLSICLCFGTISSYNIGMIRLNYSNIDMDILLKSGCVSWEVLIKKKFLQCLKFPVTSIVAAIELGNTARAVCGFAPHSSISKSFYSACCTERSQANSVV